jgi:hypothetical protein
MPTRQSKTWAVPGSNSSPPTTNFKSASDFAQETKAFNIALRADCAVKGKPIPAEFDADGLQGVQVRVLQGHRRRQPRCARSE